MWQVGTIYSHNIIVIFLFKYNCHILGARHVSFPSPNISPRLYYRIPRVIQQCLGEVCDKQSVCLTTLLIQHIQLPCMLDILYCYWWVFADLECKFISISGLIILLTTLAAIIILTVVPCQVKFEATNSQGGTGIYCQLLILLNTLLIQGGSDIYILEFFFIILKKLVCRYLLQFHLCINNIL